MARLAEAGPGHSWVKRAAHSRCRRTGSQQKGQVEGAKPRGAVFPGSVLSSSGAAPPAACEGLGAAAVNAGDNSLSRLPEPQKQGLSAESIAMRTSS